MTIFHLPLNINVAIRIVLDCNVAFYNSVVSVVYGEIIFDVELNISVFSAANISA